MTSSPTTKTLELSAKATIPLLGDPASFKDGQPPVCKAEAHDWSIVYDQTFYFPDSQAQTPPVAVVCSHCDYVVMFG